MLRKWGVNSGLSNKRIKINELPKEEPIFQALAICQGLIKKKSDHKIIVWVIHLPLSSCGIKTSFHNMEYHLTAQTRLRVSGITAMTSNDK